MDEPRLVDLAPPAVHHARLVGAEVAAHLLRRHVLAGVEDFLREVARVGLGQLGADVVLGQTVRRGDARQRVDADNDLRDQRGERPRGTLAWLGAWTRAAAPAAAAASGGRAHLLHVLLLVQVDRLEGIGLDDADRVAKVEEVVDVLHLRRGAAAAAEAMPGPPAR